MAERALGTFGGSAGGALLASARPVSALLVLLALLHAVELLVLPLLVCFGHEALGLVVPLVVGAAARALRLLLSQRARRRLREAFMVSAARDSLSQKSSVDAGADAAFWGAHILEYALCVDLPAIGGASLGAAVTLLLAAERVGNAVVGAVLGVLVLALLAGLGASRLGRRHVDAIVQRRHEMAVWMAAAMLDQGEIRSRAAQHTFLTGVKARARAWSGAEDLVERRQTLQRGVLLLSTLLCLALLARSFGFTEQLSGALTFATLGSVLLLGALLPAAYSLNVHLESLAVARAELRRLLPQNAARIPRGSRSLPSAPRRLRVDALSVSYDAATALELGSLELDLTRPVVVSGPNGAGKTTFAKLVAGLLLPTRGSISIDGTAPHELLPDEVAFVPQDPVLVEALSVLENLRLVAPDCSPEAAEAALASLGMPQPRSALARLAGSFSRGEARRIATARALLTPAKLLILDEPDAWLDTASRLLLAEALLARARASAVLLVSHRLDVISRFDQIVSLSAAHGVEAVGNRAEVEAQSESFRRLSDAEPFEAEQPA